MAPTQHIEAEPQTTEGDHISRSPSALREGATGDEVAAAGSDRRTALLVGGLFLVFTATFLISDVLIAPLLEGPTFIAQIGGEASRVALASLLALTCGAAVVGVGALLFPVLRRHSEQIAAAYLGFRVAELAALALLALAPLLLVSLSQSLTGDGQDARAVATVLVGLRDWSWLFVYLFAGIAGVLLCASAVRTGLLPRPLAVLGLIGYPIFLAGCVLDMLGYIDIVEGTGMLALVPGGLFEIVLPFWLFAKGFASSGFPPDQRAVRAEQER